MKSYKKPLRSWKDIKILNASFLLSSETREKTVFTQIEGIRFWRLPQEKFFSEWRNKGDEWSWMKSFSSLGKKISLEIHLPTTKLIINQFYWDEEFMSFTISAFDGFPLLACPIFGCR